MTWESGGGGKSVEGGAHVPPLDQTASEAVSCSLQHVDARLWRSHGRNSRLDEKNNSKRSLRKVKKNCDVKTLKRYARD